MRPRNREYWREARLDPEQRRVGLVDAFAMAFNVLTLLLVAYGTSNYRELRALWQLQWHALVHYHKFDLERVAPVQ